MTALYRKYRPELFKDIVGQEEITTTIKNQIINNKFSHAYLFTGTRGTGKTTTAKVFSKVVNCLDVVDGEPCLKCSACTTNTTDILEIDAATNNGVDKIRDLIDWLSYSPSKLKRKVVIIDEVHMLSNGAFNSLLKTLEEPPSYVVFILATTELHKIPATIKSRCQMYCFNRISSLEAIKRLEFVCQQEGIKAEKEALQLIVSNSDGAMRDSLSILDQLSANTEVITKALVEKKLGILSQEALRELTECLINKDIVSSLTIYRHMIERGQDVKFLFVQISNAIKDILIFSCSKDSSNLDGLPEYQNWIQNISELSSIEYLSILLNSLSELQSKISFAPDPTTLGENEIIRICNPALGQDINSLITRINDLERELKEIKQTGKSVEVSREIKFLYMNEPTKIKDNVNEIVSCLDITSIEENETNEVTKSEMTVIEADVINTEVEAANNAEVEEPVDTEQETVEISPANEITEVFNIDEFSEITRVLLSKIHFVNEGYAIVITTDIPSYEVTFNTLCRAEIEARGFGVELS